MNIPAVRFRQLWAPALLAVFSSGLGAAPLQVVPPSRPPGNPRAIPAGGHTWLLVCNTANDFHPSPDGNPYEVNKTEIEQFNYESGLNLPLPQGLPLLLQDRDGFPAMPLMAWDTARALGIPERRIVLGVFHDDEAGNSACETALWNPDNNANGDEWIAWLPGPVPPPNVLYGPDNQPATGDEPQIDLETRDVVLGPNQVTKAGLRAALQQLAGRVFPEDRVFIYLVDHGADPNRLNGGALYFEAGEATPADPSDDKVTGAEFDQWLDLYFAGQHKPASMVVMADFCFSEAFLQPALVREGNGEGRRAGVAASAFNQLSWYHLECMFYGVLVGNPPVYPGLGALPFTPAGSIFFWPFWMHFANGSGVEQAFDRAVNHVPPFFGGGTALAIQEPVLIDRRAPRDFQTRSVATGLDERCRDVEWRPQGDYAVVVGANGFSGQYGWNAAHGLYGDWELSTLSDGGNEMFEQVAWESGGNYALAVGWGGAVFRIDHNGGSPQVVQVVSPAINWNGCATIPSHLSLYQDKGYEIVLVGNAGEVAFYKGNTGQIVLSALQGPSQFVGCAANPLQTFQGPQNPCDFMRLTDEILITGNGGAWKFSFTFGFRDPNCGDPTMETESLVQVLNRPGLWLRRAKWDSRNNDKALCVGCWNGSGVLARLGAGDLWRIHSVPSVSCLRDLDFKPDDAYALCGGDQRSWYRVPIGHLRQCTLLKRDGARQILGLDWRPTNSQATAAAANLQPGLTPSTVDEFVQDIRF
ncbi:MAG: hypothetical protein ACE5H3_07890 [Planctomycetota bacterium]